MLNFSMKHDDLKPSKISFINPKNILNLYNVVALLAVENFDLSLHLCILPIWGSSINVYKLLSIKTLYLKSNYI